MSNEWMKDYMRINERWMNEWKDEWKDEWMNEWMNEWMMNKRRTVYEWTYKHKQIDSSALKKIPR